MRTGRQAPSRKGSPIGRRAAALAISAAIVALAALGLFYYFQEAQEAPAPGDGAAVAVEVPEGAGTAAIARILKQGGLIKNERVFRLKSRLDKLDGGYKAGSYELSKAMTMAEIMAELSKGGRAREKRFTVPEGLRVSEVGAKLASEGLVDAGRFAEEAATGDFGDYRFLRDLPKTGERLEGYLYPETYSIREDADEHAVIGRMLAQFDSLFTEESYNRAEEMGLTVNQVMTVASLIEKETKAAEEREIVASVIYNRLKKGMRLQIDATVQFALGEHKERLLYSDLEVDSPYNTYKIDGLPPAPICSPRVECVMAALYPAETDYLYYVLKPELDGRHNFSSAYNGFERDKAAYIKAIGG
ncbi:MAG: endolytic transglycosylase MltG [Clostridiales Family XIII bacterium]|jgi:UPF0755 protein|nr:endolytic transglycosylase MltG [Clostridiales Family XIII bacterium]